MAGAILAVVGLLAGLLLAVLLLALLAWLWLLARHGFVAWLAAGLLHGIALALVGRIVRALGALLRLIAAIGLLAGLGIVTLLGIAGLLVSLLLLSAGAALAILPLLVLALVVALLGITALVLAVLRLALLILPGLFSALALLSLAVLVLGVGILLAVLVWLVLALGILVGLLPLAVLRIAHRLLVLAGLLLRRGNNLDPQRIALGGLCLGLHVVEGQGPKLHFVADFQVVFLRNEVVLALELAGVNLVQQVVLEKHAAAGLGAFAKNGHAREREIGVFSHDGHGQLPVQRHFHRLFLWLANGNDRWIVGNDVDLVPDRPRILVPFAVGKANLIAIVLGLVAFAGPVTQPQRETHAGGSSLVGHAQVGAAIAVEVEPGFADFLVGFGLERHHRTHQGLDIAALGWRAFAAGVRGVLVFHAPHGDGRGRTDRHQVVGAAGIAGLNVVTDRFLQTVHPAGQQAFKNAGRLLAEGDPPLADSPLGIDRRIHHLHRFVLQVMHYCLNGNVLVGEDRRIAWRDLVDLYPGGRGNRCPRRKHPLESLQRVLGREELVHGRQGHDAQQHVTQPDEAGTIDVDFGIDLGKPSGGLRLHGFDHGRGRGVAAVAQQQQVDQRVLERRQILFDGQRGVDGVDPPQQQRHDNTHRVIPAASHDPQQAEPPPQCTQRHDPMIDHHNGQQRRQQTRQQHDHVRGDLHPLHLFAGSSKLLLDVTAVGDR